MKKLTLKHTLFSGILALTYYSSVLANDVVNISKLTVCHGLIVWQKVLYKQVKITILMLSSWTIKYRCSTASEIN